MLSRLYNPFLWRSLKVANVYVRANAATLFLDAFPLQDPDWSREEIDAVMQKQFDAMTVRTDWEGVALYLVPRITRGVEGGEGERERILCAKNLMARGTNITCEVIQ